MKNLITLGLIAVLTACGTAPVKQASAPNVQTSTGSENYLPPRQNFAGAPQELIIATIPDRKIQKISESNAEKFQKAAGYLQSESGSPSPSDSLSILDSMPATSLNDYETAFAHQMRGYAYIAKNKPLEAIEQFNMVLAKKDHIPLPIEAVITRTLALLYFSVEKYDLSLELMYKWPSLSESIASVDYYQVSLIQEKNGDLQNAIKNASKAVELTSSLSRKNFNLYSENLASLYEKNNKPLKAAIVRSQIQAKGTSDDSTNLLPIVKVAPGYPAGAIQSEISAADPVGKDAYLPNINFIKPGMNKQEVISLFRRQPDYVSSDGRTLGWAYFITAKDKKFSLRLTFDENDKALGLGEDGLMVVIW